MKDMISCIDYVAIQKKELRDKVSTFERKPKLCVVQIGNDQASSVYVRNKQKVCEEIGVDFTHVHIKTEKISQENLEEIVWELNESYDIDGIIIQLPIPNKYNVEELQKCISPEKDVDGFRLDSCFKSCTPKGIVDWLKFNDFNFTGKEVTVVGRSKIVGKPLVNMLIDEGATVTCCNSKSYVALHTTISDLVISAIGQPKYFKAADFNENTIIVDVGINRDENNKLCGDVDMENVKQYLDDVYVTPVPNGVGRLTTLSLMKNVIEAYELQNKK